MAAVNTGKLIVRSIPAGDEREQIIDFLCSYAKGAPREMVAARLEQLPLTLGNAMPDEVGNKMLLSLQEMGAEAVFVYDRVAAASPVLNGVPAAIEPVVSVASADLPPPLAEISTRAPAAPSSAAMPVPSLNHGVVGLLVLLLVLVASLAGATVVFLPDLKVALDPELVFNKKLQKVADAVNKKCPRKLGPDLRMDGFVAGNKRMTINYTLVNYESSDVNGAELRPSVSRDIRHSICREENSAELLKKGVSFVFVVHGKDGGLIFDYKVENEDCEY